MLKAQHIVNMLFEATCSKRTISTHEKAISKNIEKYRFLLGKNLSKREKKLLLRIIDGKNSIIEDTAIRNFSDGFKLGVKLGLELDKN